MVWFWLSWSGSSFCWRRPWSESSGSRRNGVLGWLPRCWVQTLSNLFLAKLVNVQVKVARLNFCSVLHHLSWQSLETALVMCGWQWSVLLLLRSRPPCSASSGTLLWQGWRPCCRRRRAGSSCGSWQAVEKQGITREWFRRVRGLIEVGGLTIPLLLSVIAPVAELAPAFTGAGTLLTSLIRFSPNISGPRVITSVACSMSSPKSSSRFTLYPPFLKDSRASADSAGKWKTKII